MKNVFSSIGASGGGLISLTGQDPTKGNLSIVLVDSLVLLQALGDLLLYLDEPVCDSLDSVCIRPCCQDRLTRFWSHPEEVMVF